MEIRIGSFNLYKFASDDKWVNKDLDRIAEIIQIARFDVLAIQEIFDKEAMDLLLMRIKHRIPGEWRGCWDKPKVGNVSRKRYAELTEEEKKKYKPAEEGYAFIWNAKIVDLVKVKLKDGRERVFKPRILNQYSKYQYTLIGRPEKRYRQELVRNPYYIRLAPVDSNGYPRLFELRLINTHIAFGKGRNMDDADMKLVQLRKQEFDMLATRILPTISDKPYGADRASEIDHKPSLPSYSILLGDYNLDLKENGNTSPYAPEIIYMDSAGKTQKYKTLFEYYHNIMSNNGMMQGRFREITTMQKSKTSLIKPISNRLKEKNPENYQIIMDELHESKGYYSNNYDHFTIDKRKFEGVTVVSERIDTVSGHPYNGDYEQYLKDVSDHVPVLLRLQIGDRHGE